MQYYIQSRCCLRHYNGKVNGFIVLIRNLESWDGQKEIRVNLRCTSIHHKISASDIATETTCQETSYSTNFGWQTWSLESNVFFVGFWTLQCRGRKLGVSSSNISLRAVSVSSVLGNWARFYYLFEIYSSLNLSSGYQIYANSSTYPLVSEYFPCD